MDPTMISVFAVGATLLAVGGSLAALILTGQRSLRTEIAAVETRLGKRIDDTKTELRTEIRPNSAPRSTPWRPASASG